MSFISSSALFNIIYIIFIYIFKIIHEVNFSITKFIVSVFFIWECCYYLDFNIKFNSNIFFYFFINQR